MHSATGRQAEKAAWKESAPALRLPAGAGLGQSCSGTTAARGTIITSTVHRSTLIF